MSMTFNPAAESVLSGLDYTTVLVLQLIAHVFVAAGIVFLCGRLGGRFAAIFGLAWWLAWPAARHAVLYPYYYYWPVPFTIGLGCLWVWRGVGTVWTLPLLVGWAQFRMTAIGTFLAMPRRAVGVAALLLTGMLVLAGHGRSQVWHDLYIGIGTRPNPYGIIHDDGCAVRFAATRGAAFHGPRYETVLRDEYLRIARTNPTLIVRNWVLNTVDAARGWSLSRWVWWVPIIVAWAAWRDRGVYRALALVWAAQCATLGFVGRPQESYLWETMGLVVVLGAAGVERALTAVLHRPIIRTEGEEKSK